MYSTLFTSSSSLETLPDIKVALMETTNDKSFVKEAGVEVLLETIEKLAERQEICTKTYQFKEAAQVKARIKELKKEVVEKKWKAIEARHRKEMSQLIETQSEQMKEFDGFWEERMQEYSKEAQDLEEQVIAQQKEDLGKLKQDLSENLNTKPKKSTQHLEYITMVKSFAKNELFSEADEYFRKCTELEKQDLIKAKKEKKEKIKTILNQQIEKQKVELNSFRKKISSGRDKLLKLREDELDKLQKKFKNMFQEVELAQQLEVSKFKMKYKLYLPDEELPVAQKKKGDASMSYFGVSILSPSQSQSKLNRFKSSLEIRTDPNSLLQKKKSLLEILCQNSLTSRSMQIEKTMG